jgi:hypothetical protein
MADMITARVEGTAHRLVAYVVMYHPAIIYVIYVTRPYLIRPTARGRCGSRQAAGRCCTPGSSTLARSRTTSSDDLCENFLENGPTSRFLF